ncbi:Hypothetical predicted protein [Mytilus galloprovincialis]|uniref:Uncharacterized protein n=1 Tax=Mytilus galloprovincialis TaxID=29158 RepID=A0A8B6H5A1_MYTGA|nr:Hypothetical predicted protein [Mytilus galloprovincialis]
MVFTKEVQNNRRISDLHDTENQEIQDIDTIKRRSMILEETYGTKVTRRIVERTGDDEKAGLRIERLPFEQCKNCYKNCRGPRHCMRCRLVCLEDKKELNSKGCDIDKNKINALRQRINVLTGK